MDFENASLDMFQTSPLIGVLFLQDKIYLA